jgi:hypothetical protein
MTKKNSNAVLAANGGLHSSRALATAQNILTNHDLRQPVLFHMVLTGSDDITTYQAAIKALVRRLRTYGCRTEYFGAFEFQPLKGLHAHCFVVIETSKKTPFKSLDIKDGGYLHKLADRNGINRIHIAKPKNAMHGDQLFARPVGDKLEDCLTWCAYVYKVRSKHLVQSRETYFNSEFKANGVKRAAELAALVAPQVQQAEAKQDETVAQEAPAAQHTANGINDKEGEAAMNADNGLSPAGHAYIERLYQGFVDRGLDVGQIRKELIGVGIRRTEGQVVYDLEERYGFTSYAALHPAKRTQTWDELDAIEEAKAAKPARILIRSNLPAPVHRR